MITPTLVLVGIPGSGKSAVGALVAAELQLPLVEVDDLVEAQLGAPAGEVFASQGEVSYREVEAAQSLAALRRPGVVVLSSGAVASAAVREALDGRPGGWLGAGGAPVPRRVRM